MMMKRGPAVPGKNKHVKRNREKRNKGSKRSVRKRKERVSLVASAKTQLPAQRNKRYAIYIFPKINLLSARWSGSSGDSVPFRKKKSEIFVCLFPAMEIGWFLWQTERGREGIQRNGQAYSSFSRTGQRLFATSTSSSNLLVGNLTEAICFVSIVVISAKVFFLEKIG